MKLRRLLGDHHVLILILLLFVFLYLPSLHYGILDWDDILYISENPVVQDPSPEHLRAIFLQPYFGNYAPLHLLSYVLDAWIWGMGASGFHLTNIMVGAVNVLLVYLLVLEFGSSRFVAGTSAAIFAFHPVQVETVAWLSERKSLLAAGFFFLSFILFVRSSRLQNRALYWSSVVAYGTALLAKISPIMSPILFWLYQRTSGTGKSGVAATRSIIPFALLSLAAGVMGIVAQHAGTGGFQWHGGSLLTTFLSVIATWFYYTKNVFFPMNLSPFYPLLARGLFEPKVFAGLCVAIIYLVLLVQTYRRSRHRIVWVAWPAVLLVPNMQIIPLPAIMADRYLYLPIVGVCVLVGFLSEDIISRVSTARRIILGAGVIVLTCLSLLTFRLEPIWTSDRTLWTYAMTRTPDEIALLNLANDYVAHAQYQEAIPLYKDLLHVLPAMSRASRNLGYAYLMLGRYSDAEEYFRSSLRYDPGNPSTHNDLAVSLMKQGRNKEAVTVLSKALELDPSLVVARVNRMELLFLSGEREPARRDAAIVLQLDPSSVSAAQILASGPGTPGDAGNTGSGK